MVEVGHKILANSLSKMTGWTGHNWIRHLPTTLRADRATTKASTGASIFPLLRGESMTFPIELEDPTRSTLPWQKLGEFDGDLAREYDVLKFTKIWMGRIQTLCQGQIYRFTGSSCYPRQNLSTGQTRGNEAQ